MRSATDGAASCRCSARQAERSQGERDESPEATAHALVQRIFELLHECRAVLPKLETPRVRPEPASAQAERVLYVALLSAIEAELVRAMEVAVTVLRQASRPLGPVGDEWLKLQERLGGPR